MGVSPLLLMILTLVIDLVVDTAWGRMNAHTNYAGWSTATILAYQHLIPLGASFTFVESLMGRGT